MRSYTFAAATDPIAYLYTITRKDGEIIRLTSWPRSIKISSNTWTPAVGLKVFDISERNDGTPASTQLSLSTYDGGTIDPDDVLDGLYAEAEVEIDLCNPDNATARDFHFYGKVGQATKPLHDVVTFELRNPYGMPRFNLVPQFTVMSRFAFGDVFCGMPIMRPAVERSTAYALGDTARFLTGISPTGYGNRYFEVTTAGTTASSAPTFDYTIGNTTTDGSVVWTARNAWERACEIDTVTDRHTIILDALPDARASADGWYGPGKFMPVTGRNKNRVFPIGLWVGSTLTATTYLPVGALCVAGDLALIWPDCNKTLAMCRDKYSNARRFGGFPFFAGARAASL